jgi:hemin uptake protein HemP
MNHDLYDDNEFTINLSDPNEFTIEGVRRLLASKTGLESDGSVPGSYSGGMYRLWVTKNGKAYIEDNAGYPTDIALQTHAILFESWHRCYVGQDAANTDWWVNHVYNMLERWWDIYSRDGSLRLGDAIFADYLPPALHK